MTNLEAAALALGVGIVIFMIAEGARKAPKAAGDPAIDPTTGGVRLPSPALYGPPAPIATGADSDSFLTN